MACTLALGGDETRKNLVIELRFRLSQWNFECLPSRQSKIRIAAFALLPLIHPNGGYETQKLAVTMAMYVNAVTRASHTNVNEPTVSHA